MCMMRPGTGMMRLDGLPTGHPNFGDLMRCPACNGEVPYPKWLQENSGLAGQLKGYKFLDWRAEPEREPARKAAISFLENPTGWLTFWGLYGRGKTFLLAAICNALAERKVHAYYRTTSALLQSFRNTYNDDSEVAFDYAFEKMAGVKVLLLDELDKVKMTDWAREKLFDLLDRRYVECGTHGTVLAMNAKPGMLPVDLGYLVSRIEAKRFRCVEVEGADVRRYQE